MDHDRLHQRAREHRANPIIYGFVRVTFQPFFQLYFRMVRIGLEHVPKRGPVLIAANHRSFLDPFVIACMARRPMYYVAKKELFARRWQAWILNALGAFPVDRGASDEAMMETARQILHRGDIVLIFPEGTRVRPGSLGRPKRGVGRLALETGAPVVPVAVIGTEAIRRGWRIRPHKVTHPRRPPAALPAGRQPVRGARHRGHQSHLAVRDAAVGVARRPGPGPPRRGHRRRRLGHGPGRAAGPGRSRGRPRLPHPRAGDRTRRDPRERPLPARGDAARRRSG